MRTVFSTEGVARKKGFQRWREVIYDRLVPVELTQLADEPFKGTIEAADVGSLAISRVSQGSLRTEATPATVRSHDKHDTLSVIIKLDGISTVTQDDRHSVQRPGDIVVVDRRPAVLTSSAGSRSYLIEVPRRRLETSLGSPRAYAAMTISGMSAGASIARAFFDELTRVHETLSAETAARMASIGVDLLVASVADALAREMPEPLQGVTIMQRAKAFIEDNLGEPTLDPGRLAAATGVSLRRLQELFQERGRCVSEWIWERRLDVAAERLSDPACAHVSIGTVAFNTGFSSQAHFSRRFRSRFGATPSEFRRNCLGGWGN